MLSENRSKFRFANRIESENLDRLFSLSSPIFRRFGFARNWFVSSWFCGCHWSWTYGRTLLRGEADQGIRQNHQRRRWVGEELRGGRCRFAERWIGPESPVFPVRHRWWTVCWSTTAGTEPIARVVMLMWNPVLDAPEKWIPAGSSVIFIFQVINWKIRLIIMEDNF